MTRDEALARAGTLMPIVDPREIVFLLAELQFTRTRRDTAVWYLLNRLQREAMAEADRHEARQTKAGTRNGARSAQYRDRRLSGLCVKCGQVAAPDRTLCATHCAAQVLASRRYKQRLRASKG